MKIFGNPWVLLCLGVLGLAAYAWFGSPLAMAVIGLPFFVVIVGGAMLARYARPAVPGAAKRPSLADQKLTIVIGIPLILAGFGYILWSRFTDTGLVGWIDSIQAQNDGKYDAKLSLIVAMFYLMIAIGVMIALLSRVRVPGAAARPVVTSAAAPRRAPASQTRLLLYTTVGMAVASWVGGFGAYEYYTMRNRQEMQATYEPADVSAQTAASHSPFVALRGRPHPLGSLSLRGEHDTDGTYFVPLVAPPGRDRDALVHFVVQLSGSSLPPLPLPLRAHDVGGTLSQTTRDAFARMGVRLAPDVVLVSYVPASSDGVVLDASADYWFYYIFGAGFASVVCVLVFLMAWLGQGIRNRRARRASLQQSR